MHGAAQPRRGGFARGNVDAAIDAARRGRRLESRAGGVARPAAFEHAALARALDSGRDAERAATLRGFAIALRERTGGPVGHTARATASRLAALLEESLGPETLRRRCAFVALLAFDEALALASGRIDPATAGAAD